MCAELGLHVYTCSRAYLNVVHIMAMHVFLQVKKLIAVSAQKIVSDFANSALRINQESSQAPQGQGGLPPFVC